MCKFVEKLSLVLDLQIEGFPQLGIHRFMMILAKTGQTIVVKLVHYLHLSQ